MADLQGIYITDKPKGKPSAWVGIGGYIRYILAGLSFFVAMQVIAWLIAWFT